MIAPWLQPPNFLGFSTAGAEAGLSAARIAQAGRDSASRIALAGQQLAAENERAKEANSTRQQDMLASLLERSQTAQLMKQYHDADIAERNRHNLVTEAKPTDKAGQKNFQLGRGATLGHFDQNTGKFVLDFSNVPTKSGLDDTATKVILGNLKHEQTRYDKANQHLSKDLEPGEVKFWKGEMLDAQQKISDYTSRLDPSSVPAIQHAPISGALRLLDNQSSLFGPVDPSALNPPTAPVPSPIPFQSMADPSAAPAATYEYEWKDGKAVKPGAE
jgi:hypothetical protein